MSDPFLSVAYGAMLIILAVAWAKVLVYLLRSYMVRPRKEEL